MYAEEEILVYLPLMAGIVGVVSVGSQSSSTADGIGVAATNWTKAVAMRPTRRVRTEGMLYAEFEFETEIMEELDGRSIRRRGNFGMRQNVSDFWNQRGKVLSRMSNQLTSTQMIKRRN